MKSFFNHLSVKKILIALLAMIFGANIGAQAKKSVITLPPLYLANGQLQYKSDSLGNRIPDFSYCGYMEGESSIPTIPVIIVVPAKPGDATARIQAALDYVAKLKPDAKGFRGAVLLGSGTFNVYGQLIMNASGVVLRGSGTGENGTKLIAAGDDRRTLIRILGENDRQLGTPIPIVNSYVPVNSFSVTVNNIGSLKVGDKIIIHRPITQKWIQTLGMVTFGGGVSALGWKPNDRTINWDRTITAINGNKITFDAPLTTALDPQYGEGQVIPYTWPGRISNVGVENMQCISNYDTTNVKDEAHSWMAITLENVENAWIRQITFSHFAGSAVMALSTSKQVTVEDCISLQPISEIGGQRRNTFYTEGQQTLFEDLYAEHGIHDFSTGLCAAGPIAFVQCYSELPYSFSGTIGSWGSGILFDMVNVDGNALRFANRGQDDRGTGWSGANSVFWQCNAALIECPKPPTAENWAFGSWSQFAGNGGWYESNNHLQPRSLYLEQLAERLHKPVDESSLMMLNNSEDSSPSIAMAAKLAQEAKHPAPTLINWIEHAGQRNPISTATDGAKTIDEIGYVHTTGTINTLPTRIVNGHIVHGDVLLYGNRLEAPWWNGSTLPSFLPKAKPDITRYVPGKVGLGLTDNLNDVVAWMKKNDVVSLDHNYGLWYDLRRDDHERVRRMDGDVWPPFYEQPFARSGEGTAWDGLSKYDLTKYNTWYWSRLKKFADLADQNGLVLLHENFFQHNILEAGAHWVDCPWRPVNNINHTGFPEPVNFAGDKRQFMAEQFYDTTNLVRKKLLKAYIRKCLENFANNTSVIQLTSAEYTGPLHFMQFWLDVVGNWEKETGKHPLIALSATKDVEDAILRDPKRAKVVDIIDIRYWFYRKNGTAYAPLGGENLAPRQHMRLVKPGVTSFAQVYRAVSEYRLKYPQKAVMYYADNYPAYGWAVFMAGGSLPNLPAGIDPTFLKDAVHMEIIPSHSNNQYILGNNNIGYIAYLQSGNKISLDLTKTTKTYIACWMNPATGILMKKKFHVKGGHVVSIKSPDKGSIVLWLSLK
ncbi:DUF6298 domain-containing protein [Microbacter margulisiae]|uniref:DUF6298 domain-containing protein n=1 Tax=Microbacter margulisiae TaxID=1350067 RepID=A0A7W5DQ32_9PORP|nr:DUF6298 domain-containing protein [Microbacter margulisiae]MBB3186989.1 hypothetical protein [Microbacter margulisiae]